MSFKYHIGIDISKRTFDFCLLDDGGLEMSRGVVKNETGFIISWIGSLEGLVDWTRTLVCMEHPGYYGAHLLRLVDEGADGVIWLENAVQTKRSMGLQRGKDDRTDAMRIALYSIGFQRKVRAWKPSASNIGKLGLLISHRDRLVRNRKSIFVGLDEQKGFVSSDLEVELDRVVKPVLSKLDGAIEMLGKKIGALIFRDVNLSRQAKIIMSIPGSGKVIAPKLIEVTKGFSKLDNPRSLACYAGGL